MGFYIPLASYLWFLPAYLKKSRLIAVLMAFLWAFIFSFADGVQ